MLCTINPLLTNVLYMCHGCAHLFHRPLRIYMGVLILGVNSDFLLIYYMNMQLWLLKG